MTLDMSGILEKAQEMLSRAAADAVKKMEEMNENDKLKQMNHDKNEPSPKSRFTTNSGMGVDNTDIWLKVAGDKQGPALLQDHHAREKIHHFDHERIPERIVHARGAAAHGVFRLHKAIPELSCADIFNDTLHETPIFLRFSTVLGSRGSSDTVRDVRGFAVKFYTREGNWDLVGNNIPVFFIQDAIKFPDIIHAGKPEPNTEVPQAQSAHNNFWDFQGLAPETSHILMWLMSDRGIPRSYRMMQGFGVNTYTLVNENHQRVFVKFHFTPELGVHSLVWDEALKLSGQDPDFHRKDLYSAIDIGAYPKWKFGIQVLKESEADGFEFDILDATKVWPEELVPVQYIGEIELNRNVDEYFPETEQVAFCTSNLVRGIDFSDDPLLQGRNFSYLDTQVNRFGGSFNFNDLPINRPVCPVMNHQRDSFMRYPITKSVVNYWPNRFGNVPPADETSNPNSAYISFEEKIVGIKKRLNAPKFKEYYNQAQLFVNSLAPHEYDHMVAAITFELSKCDDETVVRNAIKKFNEIDFNLAKTLAINVGVPAPTQAARPNHGKKDKMLSQTAFIPKEPTVVSRRIAILVADGFDLNQVTIVRATLSSLGALTFVVGPRRAVIKSSSYDRGVGADFSWESGRSTLFDALYIPGGAQSATTLRESGRCIHWVREAFHHCKPIAASGEGVEFIQEACQLPGIQLTLKSPDTTAIVDKGVVKVGKFETFHELKAIFGGNDFVSLFATEISKHRCWERSALAAKVPA